MSATELARRRKAGLNNRQDALLAQSGCPYVFEEFRFHLTLSGGVSEDVHGLNDALQGHLPELRAPCVVDQIALCYERRHGCFELIHC
ncbi:DUF1045 domain-containing protein [Tateyamaria sp. SN6-1]|uniref:DUF1045 domain-containing protein n=1 Tax=Tateyamaria sp. SN6-1 TaxID=3092148 RepID=UPI0039F5E382